MQKIKTLNECMYCGATEDLTDEHIIPLALWGDIILPKSSCKACAEITSKTERKVLKGFMQDMRNVANAPSRRKKKRPTSVERTLITPEGKSVQKNFGLDKTYSLLTVPTFSKATIFGGETIEEGINVSGHQQLSFGVNISDFLSNNSVQGIEGKDSIDVISFARLLAKIAYGMAVFYNGLFPREESPILPIILNQSNDVGFWAGSLDSCLAKPESKSKHLVLIKSDKYNFSRAQTTSIIQLFNNSGLSAFEVAVRVPNWKEIYKQKISSVPSTVRKDDTFYTESKLVDKNYTIHTNAKIVVKSANGLTKA